MKKFLTPQKKIIYGVTDRRDDNWWKKIDDFLIDNSRVGKKEKSLFFHSLQMLISSGIRFTRALEMIATRTSNLRLARILNTIAHDISAGASFSRALSKYPDIFSSSEIKMIYSGEISGEIEKTLGIISRQIQKNLEIELRVRNALLYPAIVLIAIFLAGFVVMIFVVPQFSEIFKNFSTELPLATKILIGISNFLKNFWWLLFVLFFLFFAFFQNWKNTENGKRIFDGFLLQMPLLSPLINNMQTFRIASNFSTLLSAGIPVLKSLRILSEIMKNSVIGDAIFLAAQKIKKGEKIFSAFREQKVFDPIIPEIIEIGEKSGNVAEILQKTSLQYEMEINAQLKNLTTIIEPIVILLVGGAVIFMALAIISPIFKMQEIFL